LEAGFLGKLFALDIDTPPAAGGAGLDAVIKETHGQTYFHFSSHGVYNPDDVLSSGLQLGGEEPLTLKRIIARLNLSGTKLVTVSACETAITDIARLPADLLGLPIGFPQAGAASVAGTLWPVDGVPTSLLMTRFFRLHIRHRMPPAPALRAAKLWLRDATVEEILRYLQTLGVSGGNRGIQEVSKRLDGLADNAVPFGAPGYWASFTCTGWSPPMGAV
jgi:CHAT domain-containing protein